MGEPLAEKCRCVELLGMTKRSQNFLWGGECLASVVWLVPESYTTQTTQLKSFEALAIWKSWLEPLVSLFGGLEHFLFSHILGF